MITVSIVTYNTSLTELEKVLECLATEPVDVIYVVDNSSSRKIEEFLKSHDKVIYIPSANDGYGSGHNQAIRLAAERKSKYHVVLNSDIYWFKPVISVMSEYMDNHAEVGLSSPKMFYPDGRLQAVCKKVPSPFDLFARRFLPAKWIKRHNDRFTLRATGYDHRMNIPYLSGSFMFFRVSALLDIGFFDERFFMYPEDIDISRRMHKKYATMFLPEVEIIHAHNAASYKSMKMLWVHVSNLVKYFNKWGWFIDKDRREINRELIRRENLD